MSRKYLKVFLVVRALDSGLSSICSLFKDCTVFKLWLITFELPTLVVTAFEISDSVHLKMCTIFVIKELKNYFQFNEKCIHAHNR